MKLKPLSANLGVLVGTVALLLAVVEGALRLVGFSYVLYPEEIEFGAPDPVLLETGFLEDDELFWVTPNYREKLAELTRKRPEIVFMGDSCTQFGTYDQELAGLVERRLGRKLEYGNVGVAGWTSHQGLAQLERDVVGLAPRVVTLYYGWNDHWIGFGIEDKGVSRIKKVFSSRWSDFRTVQLATQARVAFDAWHTAYPNRVSLADFRSNLGRMARLALTAGIRPVLLTAPTSIREGEEPDYLASRWLRELSELRPLHDAYASAVREAAKQHGAALCDLELLYSNLPRPEQEAAFMKDGIHFTPEGSRRTAAFLFECLEQDGLLPGG